MKRIKLIFAVGVVMVAMLALNAGSAMADEIDDLEIGDLSGFPINEGSDQGVVRVVDSR